MAENVLKLKKRALALGMGKPEVMKADRKQLEAFISSAESKPTKKKSSEPKAAKKKSGAKKSKSVKKSSGDEKAPAAKKSTKKAGKAKRPSSEKAKPSKTTKATKTKTTKTKPKKATKASDSGRAAIGQIDWSIEHKNWNPRKGSAVSRLFKALKKTKGNVNKAFDLLEADVWDFVGKKMRDGTKRPLKSGDNNAHEMLRYRLNRTKFDFATRTGQHTSATNRVDYGSGKYAKPSKSSKSKATPKAKASTKAKAGKKKGGKKSKKK
jgi:hypothetical protein